jgi:hypothetical protein
MSEDVVTPHLVVQGVKPSGWRLLGRNVQRPLEPPNLVASCQAHANLPLLGSCGRTPNQGPFLRANEVMGPQGIVSSANLRVARELYTRALDEDPGFAPG